MSHGSKTRKQRGGKTGVAGRRSREDAGLGDSLRATGPDFTLKPSARETIRKTEQMWNDVSHDWFGTNKLTFPYDMNKKDNRPVITDWMDNSTSPKRSTSRSLINNGLEATDQKKHFEKWRNNNAYGERD